jgi:hypothetical protein
MENLNQFFRRLGFLRCRQGCGVHQTAPYMDFENLGHERVDEASSLGKVLHHAGAVLFGQKRLFQRLDPSAQLPDAVGQKPLLDSRMRHNLIFSSPNRAVPIDATG